MNFKTNLSLNLSSYQADRVKIVFYTDPLCCWTWALLPHWQRFINDFGSQIEYRYCMGGMIADWNKFSDPFNSVNRPAQMGPLWMDASRRTGAVINDAIWTQDPPSSSYPACVAVKTAGLQSDTAAEIYLFAVMEAVMVQARDISKKEILLDIARQTAGSHPRVLDYALFEKNYNVQASRQAFIEDLRQVNVHRIGRFPTLTFTVEGKGLIITGYRPYEALVQVLQQVQSQPTVHSPG